MKDILVVEDSNEERSRLERLFSKAGYTVDLCSGVTEAERTLKTEDYRLAILDIGLADRSGSTLFHTIKASGRASYVIIYTGNPSQHLRNRFIQEGAVDYIVKASSQAESARFLARVRELIGDGGGPTQDAIPLKKFLDRYLTSSSRELFYDTGTDLPRCAQCGSQDYVVTFADRAQLPPELVGTVLCTVCGTKMDPKVG